MSNFDLVEIIIFCAISKNSFAKSAVKNIFLCFLLSFIVLALICRSFINFEVIFKCGVKYGFNGFLFMLSHHHLSHHPVVPASFVESKSWLLGQTSIDHNIKIYFWAIYSIPLVCISILVPIPQRLDYHCFVISFEMGKCDFSNSVLFQELS